MESIGPQSVELSADGTRFFTMLRPGTKEFLEFVRNKFDVTIWSTGMQAYVESIFDFIGIEGFTLWGRAFCKKIENCTEGEPYEKPLRQITEDLTQIAIVDNTPAMFNKCPLNGILIGTFRTPAPRLLPRLAFEPKIDATQSSSLAYRNAMHAIILKVARVLAKPIARLRRCMCASRPRGEHITGA